MAALSKPTAYLDGGPYDGDRIVVERNRFEVIERPEISLRYPPIPAKETRVLRRGFYERVGDSNTFRWMGWN